jgi:hypothetical protein
VINLGRAQRLFAGSSREAVMMHGRRCVYPGCSIKLGACQADHLRPWADGGPTDAANGAPDCPRHNRVRNRGFALRRLDHERGHWIAQRPDGTNIQPTGTHDYTVPIDDETADAIRQRLGALLDRSAEA